MKTPGHIGILALLLTACGPAVSDEDTDTTPPAGSSSSSSDTAPPPGSTTSTATIADEGSVDGGSVDTGLPPMANLGPCARVSDCLTSQSVPTDDPLARFGPGGTCWEEFPEPTCWAQCTALLESFSTNCLAEAPACCVCATVDDCTYDPANPVCVGGACTPGDVPVDCDNVSFATDIQPILTENCVECHGPGGKWPSLDMTVDAYDDLVGVDGIQTMALADFMLVVAGAPELSYILYKLEGSQAEVAGAASGAQMPNSRPPLSADLQATIRTWIECGAPR